MSTVIGSLPLMGWVLIIIGGIMVLLPAILRNSPSLRYLEQLPPVILYVYRSDGFLLVTSPILIMISSVYLLWLLLRWGVH